MCSTALAVRLAHQQSSTSARRRFRHVVLQRSRSTYECAGAPAPAPTYGGSHGVPGLPRQRRENTGITPTRFQEMARARGYDDPNTKAGVILAWLANDYGLGRGHGMAVVHVIKNGATISDTHVGTAGTHRDDSNTLEIHGLAHRRAG